jgi:putative spermidine/putrescine transport system permease protein
MPSAANRFALLAGLPLAIFALSFLLAPLARLLRASVEGDAGWAIYAAVLTNPRYLAALRDTVLVSAATTAAALLVGGTAALFLARHRFFGRSALVALLTFPLAFPGVVVGFLIILLAGRQGLVTWAARELFDMRLVLAYSMVGLFLGYLYFSIPRVLLTVMAAAEKLDPALDEAARSLGAGPWRVLIDVTLPGVAPALIASGAVAFATAMGAFGTAFTLATDIDVLPMVIYTEFTLMADIATAAALSVVLGLSTWALLLTARAFAGPTVAAGG